MTLGKTPINRRAFAAMTGAAVAMPAVWTGARAQAAFTFKLHHFLPPASNGHAKMLVPWANRVQEASKGRIKVDIFPSMQLGGTPPQLYDQVRDGVCDVVWTLPGYTAGRFPRSEALELPFTAAQRGTVNSRVAQDFATAYMQEETKEVKLLSCFAHDRGLLHTNKEIKTLEDLKGLKLRAPTRIVGEALRALGVTPVGMPVPQVPESLAQKVIDGVAIPWEVVPTVKVHELTKFHTELPGKPAFYTAVFFLAMNQAKYNSLPADLRDVVDQESGMKHAPLAGAMWDDTGAATLAMVKARPGNMVSAIGEEEKQRWIKACAPVVEKWIADMKAKNIDGGQLAEAAKALFAKYDV